MASNRRFLPSEIGGRKAERSSGAAWTRKTILAPKVLWNLRPTLAKLKLPSCKRHDDGIDRDGVACLYVYLAHGHIAFGA